MQQVVVIHGGDTFRTPEDCLTFLKKETLSLEDFLRKGWKSGLESALDEGFTVYAPRMPNSSDAHYDQWKLWFEKVIALMTDDVILVGHSLGGTFLAKYLSTGQCPKRVKAVLLVAPAFDEMGEGNREYLGSFLPPADKRLFADQAGKIYIYHSEDDEVVPFSSLADYKRDLPEAIVRAFKDRGHFLQEEFPELVEDIHQLT
ncbi:MAG: alpha/beta fold hydrolase [Candidatus Moraniibacteriota bacterium]